jgi:t-SNARE complex subunit (syntaxin)
VAEKTLEQIDEEMERLAAERQQVLDETRKEVVEDVKQKIRKYKITKTELRGALPVMRRTKPKKDSTKKS